MGDEVEAESKFVRQSGGRGQYGHVVLKMSPWKDPDGLKNLNFVDEITG